MKQPKQGFNNSVGVKVGKINEMPKVAKLAKVKIDKLPRIDHAVKVRTTAPKTPKLGKK
jgi:hypothetical protein